MRIIFNVQRVGLSNNGGSGTIIKTANCLSQIGNEVIISGDHPNKNTWVPLDNGVRYIHSPNIPKSDFIIATGYYSVRSTITSPIKNKFYYIRGFENWITSEDRLVQSYKQLKCIVNSEWLKNFLSKNGIKSNLIYPGIDDKIFFDKNSNRDIEIGGLYNKKHKTKRHNDIIEVSNKMKKSFKLLGLDISNPDPKTLNDFYNSIKVWYSPTELEGLHNCPMEASLSGCGIVVNDHERNGMSDYCIDGNTALVYKSRDLDEAMSKIELLLNDDLLRAKLKNNMNSLLIKKIGKRKDNALIFNSVLRGKR